MSFHGPCGFLAQPVPAVSTRGFVGLLRGQRTRAWPDALHAAPHARADEARTFPATPLRRRATTLSAPWHGSMNLPKVPRQAIGKVLAPHA
ncbi:hypothetical protein RHOFW510R12_06480 [Rhodanobacter sp. FW510-R12]|uniref:hypothetical protein n=1 Tax=unclassified Rhodanobacter TaxID=2621553 RepID=UPI0007A9E0CB|nr:MULTISPECIES: hypothetical protein [unclassified Rhodanobacter]KZC15378.1 hypothetical protein RHOFW104R8_05150 [Rhodanobacter sp. FW104-R8]KZC25513.1 hypothetical protein RhoFW510T8_06925 [Rhodanobacter sp. FW510-T8]KZC30217.1 hypothetical protein RhoFW510R10_02980 [Rhodanobacter sp. FW510-R10]